MRHEADAPPRQTLQIPTQQPRSVKFGSHQMGRSFEIFQPLSRELSCCAQSGFRCCLSRLLRPRHQRLIAVAWPTPCCCAVKFSRLTVAIGLSRPSGFVRTESYRSALTVKSKRIVAPKQGLLTLAVAP